MAEQTANSTQKQYQWYPGHMTKARRMMQENSKLIDLLIELADARIPYSSRNPDIDAMFSGKARILILTKADLADPSRTQAFVKQMEEQGITAVPVDARTRKGLDKIRAQIDKACAAKKERDRKRGIIGRPVRAMVAGIPNVGKSTFINSFAGKASAKTGNKPGVTRGKQWIRVGKDLELLDTPGILWPKFEDPAVGQRLAMTGAIRQELLDEQELAANLLSYLRESYPSLLEARYGLTEDGAPHELLLEVARRRNLLRAGGEPDGARAAALVLDEFRSGRIGCISLE